MTAPQPTHAIPRVDDTKPKTEPTWKGLYAQLLERHQRMHKAEARIAELEAQMAATERERQSDRELVVLRERAEAAEDAFIRCAMAIGVVYEADGVNTHPGEPDAVVRHIDELGAMNSELRERLARGQELADQRVMIEIERGNQVREALQSQRQAYEAAEGRFAREVAGAREESDKLRSELLDREASAMAYMAERNQARDVVRERDQELAAVQSDLRDMTDRYHEASGKADRLHDKIDHAGAYRSAKRHYGGLPLERFTPGHRVDPKSRNESAQGFKLGTVYDLADHLRQSLEKLAAAEARAKRLESDREQLWAMLDDIDTLDDACKGDSEWYRSQARRISDKRKAILVSLDGHTLVQSGCDSDSPATASGSAARYNAEVVCACDCASKGGEP